MTWDFGVFSLHVVQFFKIIKSSSHKNFLCFVIVHKKTLFLYYFFLYQLSKTLNILVVFFSPSLIIYISHHHFDELFYTECRVCYLQTETVQSDTITQYAKKSCFYGNRIDDTTVLFTVWSTEFGFTPKMQF